MGDKLYELFRKVIDRAHDLNSISYSPIVSKCDWVDDGRQYSIKMIASADIYNKVSCSTGYSIQFMDIESNITEVQYNHINVLVQDRIKYFKEKEKEKERKSQEIIINRLLDKYK